MNYLSLGGGREAESDAEEYASVEWLFGIGAKTTPDGLPYFFIDNYRCLECRVDNEYWRISMPRHPVTFRAGDEEVTEFKPSCEIPTPKTKGRFRVLAQLLGIVTDEG